MANLNSYLNRSLQALLKKDAQFSEQFFPYQRFKHMFKVNIKKLNLRIECVQS